MRILGAAMADVEQKVELKEKERLPPHLLKPFKKKH